MSQFRDYIEIEGAGEDQVRLKKLPRLEEGTVIEHVCFVTDVDGDCFWIDPASKTITRIE